MEPQARLSDLLRAGVEPADQTTQAIEAGQTRRSGRAAHRYNRSPGSITLRLGRPT